MVLDVQTGLIYAGMVTISDGMSRPNHMHQGAAAAACAGAGHQLTATAACRFAGAAGVLLRSIAHLQGCLSPHIIDVVANVVQHLAADERWQREVRKCQPRSWLERLYLMY